MPTERLADAFRPAVEADLPRILDLRRAVGGEGCWWNDEAYLRWRYFECGVEPSAYWVFDRDGEIVGACGLEPVVLVVDGQAHRAMRALDIMLRPDVERRGLGAYIYLALFERFPIIIATGSNDRSHRLISRMFRHTLDLRCWKALVRSAPVLEHRLGLRFVAGAAAAMADRLLALERRLRRRHASFEIREMARFDDSVTELSMACEGPGRVMVRRSAEYLNWRFVDNPRCRHTVLGAFDGHRLVGYVVVRLNLARPNPRRVAEIVDWLVVPDSDDRAARALLGVALDRLAAREAGLVLCMAFDDHAGATLSGCGLRSRPQQRLPFFVRAGDAALHARLSSPVGWRLTLGDFDVE
ncbi:MAG TPA: GNAT family N-acetyltransferase [Vicinamibacterales bacterium]|nr:GNAT family N-acetyltransferase [Vicinamibacterales bacterium]